MVVFYSKHNSATCSQVYYNINLHPRISWKSRRQHPYMVIDSMHLTEGWIFDANADECFSFYYFFPFFSFIVIVIIFCEMTITNVPQIFCWDLYRTDSRTTDRAFQSIFYLSQAAVLIEHRNFSIVYRRVSTVNSPTSRRINIYETERETNGQNNSVFFFMKLVIFENRLTTILLSAWRFVFQIR